MIDHFAVVRAWLLLGILGVWCVYLGGHGGVDAFAVPGRLQQQRLSGRRSCLSRGGPQSIKRRCVSSCLFFLLHFLEFHVRDSPAAAAPTRLGVSLTTHHEHTSALLVRLRVRGTLAEDCVRH